MPRAIDQIEKNTNVLREKIYDVYPCMNYSKRCDSAFFCV